MTITLDLPQELENALSIQAKQFGVSLQEYLLHVLYTSLSAGRKPKNGTEVENQRFSSEEPDDEAGLSLMAKLRKITISASPDFSMKVDLYEPEGRDAR